MYDKVEEYISTTFNQAAAKEKSAVGFVMTTYRRRLASSFHALERTMSKRLDAIERGNLQISSEDLDDTERERLPLEPFGLVFIDLVEQLHVRRPMGSRQP